MSDDGSYSSSPLMGEEENISWLDAAFDEEVHQIDHNWIDVKNATTVISFDQANHEAWEAAKIEIGIIRSNLINALRLEKLSDFSMFALLELFFGPRSALWKVLDDNLNGCQLYTIDQPLTHAVFKKIMGTFFVASSLGISAKRLWNDPFIDQSDLCTHDEYIKFWKFVSKRDMDKRFDVSIDYLWLKVLDTINQLCRDLFLRNWDPYREKFITIDDDKLHFNGKMGYFKTAGLKATQLVRDNRRGFVFHTLVFTASGVPLGVDAELVTDQNSFEASSRLIRRQLCPNHRSNQIPDLTNVTIFADRLYWSKEFLYNFVLPSGADVGPSTHKRSHHYPFTFDQKLTRNDTRMLINKKGPKCVFVKEQRVGQYTLSAIAYRDGHGKVVLGISSGLSQFRYKQWEFHLKSPADRYKILDDDGDWCYSKKTWIRNLIKGDGFSDLFLRLFDELCRVEAVTTEGSEDQAWFLARSFSFTSSTADKVINKVLDLVAKGEVLREINFVTHLNKVLVYLSKPLITVQE